MKKILFLLGVIWFSSSLTAQVPVHIDLVTDHAGPTQDFSILLKEEITSLLGSRYQLAFRQVSIPDYDLTQANALIDQAMTGDAAVIITLGFTGSSALYGRADYPKPCIAGITLNLSESDSSGVDNFSYIETPFSIEGDFQVLKSIIDFEHLAIFVDGGSEPVLRPYIDLLARDFSVQFISGSGDYVADLAALDSEIDAVYFLPVYQDERMQSLINGVNALKIPSFSLLGRRDVERGVLASVATSAYILGYARRIALYVMKVLEGENLSGFSVRSPTTESDFVINAHTMKQIEIYPPLDVLARASMVDYDVEEGEIVSLAGCIAQALENNLGFQGATKSVAIQGKEVEIARSSLLPQIEVNSSLVTIDQSSADLVVAASQLTPQTKWNGNAQLSQIIYAEPVYANLAIQKMLQKADQAGLDAQELDLTLDVSMIYLNLLLAKANVKIQHQNVDISRKNLAIARSKASIGASSQADVYGFETQLATNQISLNDAITALEQARIGLNTQLNLPLETDLVLLEIDSTDEVCFILDDRINDRISNQYDIRKLNEYLIEHAMTNVPTLEQLDWSINAQERLLKSQQRSFFLPQFSFQVGIDQTLGRYGTRVPDQSFEALGVDPYKPTWNAGAGLNFPIFQGRARRSGVEKSVLELEQLTFNRENASLGIESQIRSGVENVANAYNNMLFAQQAEESASKFLVVIADLYREGASNINTLLDAQNNALFSQLSAASTYYQLLSNSLILERSIGSMFLTSSPEQKQDFVDGYLEYMLKK